MARMPTASGGPIAGSTIIGPEIRVLGRVTGEEDLHVQGRIDGAIVLTETLFVAPGGVVSAEVDALNVVVSGVIVGNVTARDCVTLHAGAKLVGDITAPRLVIADGAAFKGNVHMGGEPDNAVAARSAARARPAPAAAPRRQLAPERAPAPPRRATPARAEPARPEPARAEPARPAPARAAPRTPRAEAVSHADDEATVIVRHSEVAAGEDAGSRAAEDAAPVPEQTRFRGVSATRVPSRPQQEPEATSKGKLPARARIPKPGKRRVNRR